MKIGNSRTPQKSGNGNHGFLILAVLFLFRLFFLFNLALRALSGRDFLQRYHNG